MSKTSSKARYEHLTDWLSTRKNSTKKAATGGRETQQGSFGDNSRLGYYAKRGNR